MFVLNLCHLVDCLVCLGDRHVPPPPDICPLLKNGKLGHLPPNLSKREDICHLIKCIQIDICPPSPQSGDGHTDSNIFIELKFVIKLQDNIITYFENQADSLELPGLILSVALIRIIIMFIHVIIILQ